MAHNTGDRPDDLWRPRRRDSNAVVLAAMFGVVGLVMLVGLLFPLLFRGGSFFSSTPGAGLGGSDVTSVTIARIMDGDVATRAAAARELGRRKVGETKALGLLKQCLKDPYKEVRLAAVWAIGEIGAKEEAYHQNSCRYFELFLGPLK